MPSWVLLVPKGWWVALIFATSMAGALRWVTVPRFPTPFSPAVSPTDKTIPGREWLFAPVAPETWETAAWDAPVTSLEPRTSSGGIFRVDPYTAYASWEETGLYPDAVVIGDVVGDARPDIVMTTVGPFTGLVDFMLLVFEQKPDGSLRAPIMASYFDQTALTGLDLVDLDSDGRAEIIVGHGSGLTVFKRQGAGFVATKIEADREATNLAILDVDHDGHPDVFAQSGQSGANIYFSNGSGGFDEIVPFSTAVFGIDSLEVRDFTGDGLDDVILTNGQGFSKVWVHAGDLDSGLRPAKVFDFKSLLRYPPKGMVVADFNNDGRLDIALSDSGDTVNQQPGIQIVYQNAAGELVNPVKLMTAHPAGKIVAADLDGNGLMDIAALYNSWNTLAYFLQQPGGFQPAVTLSTTTMPGFNAFYRDTSMAAGDVNSDGCADIVVADPNSGLLVFPGRNCQPRRAPPIVYCRTQAPVAGDMSRVGSKINILQSADGDGYRGRTVPRGVPVRPR